MDKIYSRPRIRIPKIRISRIRFGKGMFRPKINLENRNNIKSKKIIKMSKILIIWLIAFITVKTILDAILPVFDTLCEDRAKSIATMVSNEQATNVMKEHSYDEMFTIEKDSDGNITMIKSNVLAINEIISDVAVKIQEGIEEKGREDIEIALRNFYRL